MRIVSWNVNGIRAASRNGFLQWLAAAQPDVVCIQETRVGRVMLEEAVLNPPGYTSLWQSAEKPGYSGVGAYVKAQPLSVDVMNVPEFDREGRVQVLEYDAFTLVNAYFPNSQRAHTRLDYKLDFCRAMWNLCQELRGKGKNVVLCGDYNIAHEEIDLARPKDNENNAGFLPQERAAMSEFLSLGYVDTFRHFCQDGGHYTWWSVVTNARPRNIGWRIDYFCVNQEFMPRVTESVILPDVMGSDHCPVAITVE